MPTFSHSRIESFRQCPRKYFYQYVARIRLPEVPEHIATFLGSRCHDALEWLYSQTMTGVIPSREETLTHLAQSWNQEWSDDIVITDEGMTPAHYRSLAAKCVGDYYDANQPFDDSTTIALEKQVRFPLNEQSGIRMLGHIDRLARSDNGVWHVHDYRTNKKLPTQADKDLDPQLAYYEIGIRQMWPESVEQVQLHWHFLRFGVTITSTRTANQLEKLRQDALATIGDALRRGRDEEQFEPIESGLCRLCDYQSICPVKKHEITVNGLPANRYRSEPGVVLVNRWAELKAEKGDLNEQIAEIDEEIDEIQEALIEYAEAEDVSVVVGDEFEATVKIDERTMFPRKGSEPDEYDALERTLAKSPFWDQVSSMDAARLRSLWKDPAAFYPELRKLLKQYVWIEEETKTRLRQRKG